MLRNQTAPRISAPDLLQIVQAPDWEQLRSCMQRLLAPLGICDFMLQTEIANVNGASQMELFGSLPNAVLQQFSLPAEDQTDPVRQHLARSRLPLSWQVEQLCLLHSGHVYPLLKTMGVTQGMSLAIHSKHAASRLDFYSNAVRQEALPTSAQADALLLGVHLQEAAELLWRKAAPDQGPMLSARELECLRWSADGKTSSEIGLILGISQRTVYFHMKNVAMKLGVYSTRHAISKAVMMGIIKPDT
ncbi:DNA-binding transcriptional regulator, CsgD family [Collimonas sp. OK242]|uniref:helix-turn-helix transcriptional regulator n=1 Tax=Collimonas sp. OK242 TaxID=1798195 RepID=UPI0008981D9F|nr:LuxR family transcriptional regulator [Collimonas sp. OK242]SDY49130.1 DNA-binding transcriptional regulator, CsgD family [Collimonas sp. OK242]